MASALRKYAKEMQNPAITTQARNDQVVNNTGGFVFQVTDRTRLERFLILGTDGGTYYVKEMDLTKQNVDFLRNLIKTDESLVLNTTLEISSAGRAYRNDAAIFVMALLLSEGKNKSATIAAIPDVVRTGTHVYTLAEYISTLGGWGRAKRDAVAKWFNSKSPDQLAYQAVKYRQRNGWTLRDLMRKSHVKGVNPVVGNFILTGKIAEHEGAAILQGFSWMQKATSVNEVIRVLDLNRNLPWETIPTQYLTDLRVWKKLFENGQLAGQALLRNITRLARLNAFDDLSFAGSIATALTDEEMISRTRLHPMQYLNAYVVYTEGQIASSGGYFASVSRQKSWNTSAMIKDALDDGFGLSFGNIEPSNKCMMISVDVSGSMSWSSAGSSNFTCAQAAGAMALVTARVEPTYMINGFSEGLKDLGISGRDSIENAFRKVQLSNFGGTNISAPFKYASERNLEIDAFVVITDNEVNSGGHPYKALKDYRNKSGIDSRLIVMGMTATNFSIADPLDRGMLDVVGFDTNTPKVVSDFSAGRI